MAINPDRPIITYENVALFQGESSNSGDIKFLPGVQSLSYSFDLQRNSVGQLGSKKFISRNPGLYPDINLEIQKNEDFNDLFSNYIKYGEFQEDKDFKSNRDFYMVIGDERGEDIGFDSLSGKDCISFGKCFLNNLSISQNVNGLMTSSYSFVGSYIQAEEVKEETVYWNDFEDLDIDTTNLSQGGPVNVTALADTYGNLSIWGLHGGNTTIVQTVNASGLDGDKNLRMSDGGGAFQFVFSGFEETGIYRFQTTFTTSGSIYDNVPELSVAFSTNNGSNFIQKFKDISNGSGTFVDVTGAIGEGQGIRLELHGNSNHIDNIFFQDFKISKVGTYAVNQANKSNNLYEEYGTNAVLGDIDTKYKTGESYPYHSTDVAIKRNSFDPQEFVVDKSSLSGNFNPGASDTTEPEDAAIVIGLRSSWFNSSYPVTDGNRRRVILKIKGETIIDTNFSISHYAAKVRLEDGEFKAISSGQYNVHTSETTRQEFLDFLQTFKEGEMLIFATHDQPDPRSSTVGQAITSFMSTGFNSTEFSNVEYRDAMNFVGFYGQDPIYEEWAHTGSAILEENSETPRATVYLPKERSEFIFNSDSIQGFDLNLPIARKNIYSLGDPIVKHRKPLFPNECSFSFSSVVSSLNLYKTESLSRFLNNDHPYSIHINGTSSESKRYNLIIKDAKLSSQNFSSQIGDRSMVDLTYVFDGQDLDRTNYLNNQDRTFLYLDAANKRCVNYSSDTVYDLAPLPLTKAYPNNTGNLNFYYSNAATISGLVGLNDEAFVFENQSADNIQMLTIKDDRESPFVAGFDNYTSRMNESFTWLVWAKNTGNGTSTLMRQRHGNEERPRLNLRNDDKLQVFCFTTHNWDGTDNSDFDTSVISDEMLISDGEWNQYAFTYRCSTGSAGVDNTDFTSTITFYHNDQELNSITNDQIIYTGSQALGHDFYLGGMFNTSGTNVVDKFQGEISIAAIYDKILTHEEIADNYNRIRGRYKT